MRRHRAILVLTAFIAIGCSSWHARVAPSAADAVSFAHPIRVTRADRSVVVLDHARVSGDSLVGEQGGARVALPISDVQRLDERRISGPRTTALVVGSLLAAFVVLAIVAAATIPPDWN